MKVNLPNSCANLLMIIAISSLLCACITMPGYRQVINEDNFNLLIIAPNEQTKQEIQFDTMQSELVHLPMNSSINFASTDEHGEHELLIKNVSGEIIYEYRINGHKATFDTKARSWFTEHIPQIIKKSGLETHL